MDAVQVGVLWAKVGNDTESSLAKVRIPMSKIGDLLFW